MSTDRAVCASQVPASVDLPVGSWLAGWLAAGWDDWQYLFVCDGKRCMHHTTRQDEPRDEAVG